MARTQDMFAELKPPRAKPRVMMHGVDFGYDGDITLAHMICARCGHGSDWLMFENDTEARRGAPCPKCNGCREGLDNDDETNTSLPR